MKEDSEGLDDIGRTPTPGSKDDAGQGQKSEEGVGEPVDRGSESGADEDIDDDDNDDDKDYGHDPDDMDEGGEEKKPSEPAPRWRAIFKPKPIAVMIIIILVLAFISVYGPWDEPYEDRFTAEEGFKEAKKEARKMAVDPKLVWLIGGGDGPFDGKDDEWRYLFFSERKDITIQVHLNKTKLGWISRTFESSGSFLSVNWRSFDMGQFLSRMDSDDAVRVAKGNEEVQAMMDVDSEQQVSYHLALDYWRIRVFTEYGTINIGVESYQGANVNFKPDR